MRPSQPKSLVLTGHHAVVHIVGPVDAIRSPDMTRPRQMAPLARFPGLAASMMAAPPTQSPARPGCCAPKSNAQGKKSGGKNGGGEASKYSSNYHNMI